MDRAVRRSSRKRVPAYNWNDMRLASMLALVTTLIALPALGSDADDALRDALRRFGQGHRPGAAAVVLRGGKVLAIGALGLADVEARRALLVDTPLHLASVGKQMTAVAVLKLVERGALRLDRPVAIVLPEFSGWGDAITIRHLLQHTSGLPDYYAHYEDDRNPPTNDDVLKLLARWRRLDFPPGTRHEYSNAGYDTLAAVIERVSHVSFGTFIDREILAPLGMRHTFAFDDTRRRRERAAKGYSREGGRFEIDDHSPLNLIHGSGSIYSSVADMGRYDAALFGERLLPKDLLAQMLTPARLKSGRKVGYGFGWEIGGGAVSHSGSWMGFASYYLHRDDGLSVIVLSNDASADAQEIAEGIAEALEEELAGRPWSSNDHLSRVLRHVAGAR